MQLDVDVNMTLEIDDDAWKDAVEAADGDEDEVLEDIRQDLEGEYLSVFFGPVTAGWICWAETPTFL